MASHHVNAKSDFHPSSPPRSPIKHVQPPSPAFSTPPTLHGFDNKDESPFKRSNVSTSAHQDLEDMNDMNDAVEHLQVNQHPELYDVDSLIPLDDAEEEESREESEVKNTLDNNVSSRRMMQASGSRRAVVGPRMTKSAALRTGTEYVDPIATRSTRVREAVDFGNTPGHKREGMRMVVASTSSPTIMPRQTKASLLRTAKDPLGSVTNPRPTLRATPTRPRPVSIAPTSSPYRGYGPGSGTEGAGPSHPPIDVTQTPPTEPARPRVARPQSLYAPTITPRANKAAMLRLGAGGVGSQADQENKKGSPEQRAEQGRSQDGGAALGRSRSVVERMGSPAKGVTTPRSTRPTDLRVSVTASKQSPTLNLPSTRSPYPATPSTSSRAPRSPHPSGSTRSGSVTSSTYGAEPPRSTLDRYKLLDKDEQKRRDERLYDNVPGHKKRLSMGPGAELPSLAEPRMAPRSNRAAALRRDPTLQYLPPPPPAFKARPLPGQTSTANSVYSQRPATATGYRSTESAVQSPRRQGGAARVGEGSQVF